MKRKNIVILTSIALITIIFATIGLTNSKVEAKSNVTMGNVYEIVEVLQNEPNKVADFIFLDDDGNKCSLSEYTKGKYVFQNFWGTWCPPCRGEIPTIIELQKENNEQLIMIGIALEKNHNNQKENVMNYAKNQGINYINFVGPAAVIGKLQSKYNGIPSIPTTHLINKDGVIVETIVGARNKAGFQASLDKLMK